MINLPYTNKLSRPLGLMLLLLAAVALTFFLEAEKGLAAPGWQNSPLTSTPRAITTNISNTLSPLNSPISTPTSAPTPTATSPLPSTAEPPANLQLWPTPTPTPYTASVQAAIEYLISDAALAVTSAEPSVQILVDDPSTGAELTVVRLRDSKSGEDYWLRVDESAVAERLTAFEDQALVIVSETEKVALADLSIFQSLYSPFPFTRQMLWVARVFNSKGSAQVSVALNLAGEEVDLDIANEEEAAAVADYCGVLDVSLCLEILYAAEGAASNVVLVLVEESDPAPFIAFLDDAQIAYRQDEETFYFRMENGLLRELAHLENIDRLLNDFPDEVRVLDTNLLIGLIEQSGALSLTLESQKMYPLLTYQVEATLTQVEITQTQSVTFVAQIDGIFSPTIGPSGQAPAQARLPLGKLNGRYNLSLAYTDPERELDLLDNYILIVSDGRAVIRSGETTFSWAKYPTWLRLPLNAFWFVVQARTADEEGKRFEVDRESFDEKAAAFYTDIGAAGARDLSLSEGSYTNALFVPPWTTWQIPDGDFVQIPINERRSYTFHWPDIRYFTYSGSLRSVEGVIAAHCVDEVSIVGYTANGDTLDACQQ